MVSAISNVTQTQASAQFTGTSTQKPTESGPPSATSTDSVQLSKTAQALASVLQEARETHAQTAKEAGYGDLQAQRLLAREAAAKSVAK